MPRPYDRVSAVQKWGLLWMKRLGTLLILMGLVALLVVAGMVGYDQWRRADMQRRVAALRRTPVATPLAATASPTLVPPTPSPWATPTPVGQVANLAPTPTIEPPSPSPTPPSPTSTSLPLTRPVRMRIPALALDIPVVEVQWEIEEQNGLRYSVWKTASYAAGHHFNSANPGEQGNVVLSGHHNIEGEVFRDISAIGEPGARLSVGDEIILYAEDGRAYVYRIVEWHRFQEAGASAEERAAHARFAGPSDRAILTLVTCWPYTNNTHRVVVVAELVGPYLGE